MIVPDGTRKGRPYIAIERFDANGFTTWLERQTAVFVEAPVVDNELVRYRYDGLLFSVFEQPSKARAAFQMESWWHYRDFVHGKSLAAPPPAGKVSIYSDAGYWSENSSGTWGAVLCTEESTHEASGRFKQPVINSTAAEACAVANALHIFVRRGLIADGSVVNVYCDNTPVVRRLNGVFPSNGGASTNAINKIVNGIFRIADRHNITLRPVWVKGHQAEDSTCQHAPYNRRADRLATLQRKQK